MLCKNLSTKLVLFYTQPGKRTENKDLEKCDQHVKATCSQVNTDHCTQRLSMAKGNMQQTETNNLKS